MAGLCCLDSSLILGANLSEIHAKAPSASQPAHQRAAATRCPPVPATVQDTAAALGLPCAGLPVAAITPRLGSIFNFAPCRWPR